MESRELQGLIDTVTKLATTPVGGARGITSSQRSLAANLMGDATAMRGQDLSNARAQDELGLKKEELGLKERGFGLERDKLDFLSKSINPSDVMGAKKYMGSGILKPVQQLQKPEEQKPTGFSYHNFFD